MSEKFFYSRKKKPCFRDSTKLRAPLPGKRHKGTYNLRFSDSFQDFVNPIDLPPFRRCLALAKGSRKEADDQNTFPQQTANLSSPGSQHPFSKSVLTLVMWQTSVQEGFLLQSLQV